MWRLSSFESFDDSPWGAQGREPLASRRDGRSGRHGGQSWGSGFDFIPFSMRINVRKIEVWTNGGGHEY